MPQRKPKPSPKRDRPLPRIDEAYIMQALDRVSSPLAFNALVTGAHLSIIDGFDRQIDRDPYNSLVEDAIALVNMGSRLHAVNAMLRMMEKGTLTREKMEEARVALTKQAEIHRTKLMGLMDKVRQCPTLYDQIH